MRRFSLIPFLAGSESGFVLEIAAYDAVPGFLGRVAPGGSPFTRILGGRVRFAGVGAPRPVVMVLARDDYPRIDVAHSALTNRDIERMWMEVARSQGRHPALIPLTAQVDAGGDPVVFDPLFCCRQTGRYFAPPCPTCGQALTLCTDDELLKRHGLKPYSASLSRYLACSACGGEIFYAYEKDGAEPAVRGPSELITGLGGLAAGDLPCVGCPEHAACYGAGQVLARISPVAFYPFSLLIYDAAALSALDYLSLAAGTPFCEQAGSFEEREGAVPSPEAGPAAETVQDREDAEIGRILGEIRTRWEREVPPRSEPPAVPQPSEEAPEVTLMLTPEAVSGASRVEEKSAPPVEDDFHTETIIMQPAPLETQPPAPGAREQTILVSPEPPVPPREAAPVQDLEATVMMGVPAEAPAAPPEPPVADEMTATVIMGAPVAPKPQAPPAEDEMAATVMMGAPAKPAPPPQASADDEMAETVILKPKK